MRETAIFSFPGQNLTSPLTIVFLGPRFSLGRKSFGNDAIKRVILHVHARNSRVSTSGLKSDVIIIFLDPDFPKDAEISAIRVHLRQI